MQTHFLYIAKRTIVLYLFLSARFWVISIYTRSYRIIPNSHTKPPQCIVINEMAMTKYNPIIGMIIVKYAEQQFISLGRFSECRK